MIMSVDKSWLTNPKRRSPEYQQGLISFIEMCKEHVNDRGYVRCPCARCQNSILIPFEKMKFHMHAYGICRAYKVWTHHGESLIPAIVVDDVAPTNNMAGVIEDVKDEQMEKDPNLDEGNSGKIQNDLKAVLESQTEPISEGEYDESSASHPNEAEVFEKVTGARREHTRGVADTSFLSTASSFVGHYEQDQTRPAFTKAQIESWFKDPNFLEELSQFIASNKASKSKSSKSRRS